MLTVTLIQQKYINTIILPDKKEGFYRIEYHVADGSSGCLNIEGTGDKWNVYSDSAIKIIENEKVLKQRQIDDSDVFIVKIHDEECIVLSEPVKKERCKFKKLFFSGSNVTVSIGKKPENTISIKSDYVSGNHARIIKNNGVWTVQDTDSQNGTYLNNRRVEGSEVIHAGDVIFILGYKFIIGYDFIAANIYDDAVKYNKDILFETEQKILKNDDYSAELPEYRYFYRTIKIEEEKFVPQELRLELPPKCEEREKISSVLRVGPSITMCSGSVMIAGYSIIAAYYRGTNMSYVVPSVIMAATMMTTAVMWPLIINKVTAKTERKKESERREMYLNYINTARGEIKRLINDESDVMNRIYFSAEKCAQLAIGQNGVPDKFLWCKNIKNDDFLMVCLGKGDIDAGLILSVPDRKLSIKKDFLEDNLYQLASEERKLVNVNIPLSLKTGLICGLTGEREAAMSFIKAVTVQLTSLYSYDELKLVFIYNEKESKFWNYSRWLPHVWNNDNSFRYVAVTNQDIKELSAVLSKEVDDRLGQKELEDRRPYYLIISADRELTEKLESTKLILENYKNIRFGMITLFDLKNYIDSDIIFDFDKDHAVMYKRGKDKDEKQAFVPDSISDDIFSKYIGCISNIKLDLFSQRYSLPDMLTFLEMFRVSKVEHLNCLTRWVENDPSSSLQTPIGVNQSGDAFYLDLHEKFHGPHGLIAGTTGSGKSESIITFILSLAVNYSPEEAAFLIIDYKGGGLADAFESVERINENGKIIEKTVRLPHLVGTVTNLDGATVERSRISIESELKRRQNLFKEARKMSNEGTMDIYKYQKFRRNGMKLEALPHLFIVCDEFAELKSQKPEFMESLISTARIGRSLGVHLILATQKPDTVVSPQIWSNSRFKICLKVQDKSDSSAVIHCPDAAEISTTGRFYLQVGYNEFFSLGQSAWCGANYVPSDSFRKEREKKAELISGTGSVLCEKKIKAETKQTDRTVSELVAVRQYLISIARNIHIHPLWLSPLPSYISLNQLYKEHNDTSDKYEIAPVIGKWDDLYERNQEIMTVPFSKNGNVCIYGAVGSGVDMFLNTLVYSLISAYTADEVNIYILDFDSGFMRIFENAPQVGNVILSDEVQNVLTVITKIKDEISRRNKLFAAYGGEYSEYCRRSGDTVPNIVFILNNYLSFTEEYENQIPDLMYISREGAKRGIYFVLGTSTVNINNKIKQNISLNYVLRMNDKMDYSMVLGRTNGIVPSEFAGRGILRIGSNVFEFQTADFMPPPANDDEPDIMSADPADIINSLCLEAEKKCTNFATEYVKRIKSLDVSYMLTNAGSINNVPLGQLDNENDAFFADLSDKYIVFASSNSEKQLSDYAVYIASVLAEDTDIDVVLLDSDKTINNDENRKYRYVGKDDEFEKWTGEYHSMYIERDKALVQDENGRWMLPENKFRNVWIVINKFEQMASVCRNCAAQLNIAMLGCEIHNIHYIVLDTVESMRKPNGCYSRIIVRGNNPKDVFTEKNAHDDWFAQLGIWLGAGFENQSFFRTDDRNRHFTFDNTAVTVSDGHVSEIFRIAGE